MSKTQRQRQLSVQEKNNRRLAIYMWLIPTVAFIIKLITMRNIPNGAWLGADGENYTGALDGLLKDGFASKESKLQYWPAGYPMLLWILAKISIAHFYQLVSIVQSLFYGFASYYFSNVLRKSPLKVIALPTALILAFNPTLSLSSMAVGYESPVAACFLLILALMVENPTLKKDKKSFLVSSLVGALLALTSIMQPRFLLVGLILIFIWIFKMSPKKIAMTFGTLSILIMAIAPAALIIRNNAATGNKVISTNLGVTMRIGAGDQTNGGYKRTGPEVPCDPIPPATSVTDNQVVRCVLKWYYTHPVKSAKLALTKTAWFWSPWSGPVANGTMARNPWLKIDPVMSWLKTPSGNQLVLGGFGKLISWMWVVGQIFLLFAGFYWFWKSASNGIRKFGILLLTPIMLSWLVAIGTIGDHRFRIPTMSLSLVLQIAGWYGLFRKFRPIAS